jgi:hypothetical protein
MGELHVKALAELIGGRVTPGSGNQWKDPIDARASHLDTEFAFAAEGKSTLGASISFSRALIAKAQEQAGGERPLIGLRFYGTEDLHEVDEDWSAIQNADLSELLEKAAHPVAEPSDELLQLRAEVIALRGMHQEEKQAAEDARAQLSALQARGPVAAVPLTLEVELSRLREDSEFKTRIIAGLRDQLHSGGRSTLQAAMSSPPPVFPWLSVFQLRGTDRRSRHTGIFYDATGQIESISISGVRVEREIDNKPRLIVNETLVRQGELYIDGMLHTRVGAP